jgi:hypothetical protein
MSRPPHHQAVDPPLGHQLQEPRVRVRPDAVERLEHQRHHVDLEVDREIGGDDLDQCSSVVAPSSDTTAAWMRFCVARLAREAAISSACCVLWRASLALQPLDHVALHVDHAVAAALLGRRQQVEQVGWSVRKSGCRRR